MLMKNRKLYQMLAVTAGVLLLSGCGASSAQETGITSSDPQEPTTISEETKAPDSTESTENTKSTESKASESESSAETAAETESQLQQSEIQPQQTDQQISRINYYDTDDKLIYYDSYAYYDNGLLCSTTLHSVDYYDNGNGEQDSYTGNEYTFLYLYDADGNIKTTMPASLTIADNYNDETGEFVLDYDYDEDGNEVEEPSYNEYGDYVVYRPNSTSEKPIYGLSVNYTVNAFPKETYIDSANAEFQKFMDQGIKVYFTYSPRNKYALSKDSTQEERARLHEYFKSQLHVPVISELEDSLYTGIYLYGTDNHLSTEGAQIRTEKVIHDLKEQLAKEEKK